MHLERQEKDMSILAGRCSYSMAGAVGTTCRRQVLSFWLI
jgi:hypothetical protein